MAAVHKEKTEPNEVETPADAPGKQHAAGLRLTHAWLLASMSLKAGLCCCHTQTHLSVMVSRSPLATPFITVLAFGVRTTWETKKVPFLLWKTHQVCTKKHSYSFF